MAIGLNGKAATVVCPMNGKLVGIKLHWLRGKSNKYWIKDKKGPFFGKRQQQQKPIEWALEQASIVTKVDFNC